MRPQYVELERDLTLLLWLGISMNDNLSQKFGSPLSYLGGFLESFLKDKLKKPSKRINGHLHRVQHDILILTCTQESWQFGLARQILFPMEYAPVFCGTNLLSLDELQVNGEGVGSTEMLGFSDKCSHSDDSEVVIEDNSDHSGGGYSARCSKSGKSDRIFQVLKQSEFDYLLDLIRISSG